MGLIGEREFCEQTQYNHQNDASWSVVTTLQTRARNVGNARKETSSNGKRRGSFEEGNRWRNILHQYWRISLFASLYKKGWVPGRSISIKPAKPRMKAGKLHPRTKIKVLYPQASISVYTIWLIQIQWRRGSNDLQQYGKESLHCVF